MQKRYKRGKSNIKIGIPGRNQMISMKMYKRGSDLLIGACDEKLLGKTFEDGKYQIEVTKSFYGGEKVTSNVLQKLLEDATIANLVGDETIKAAVDMGLVDPQTVIKIKGVPHAQMVRMLR